MKDLSCRERDQGFVFLHEFLLRIPYLDLFVRKNNHTQKREKNKDGKTPSLKLHTRNKTTFQYFARQKFMNARKRRLQTTWQQK